MAQKKIDWSKTVKDLEAWVVQGQHQEVHEFLNDLTLTSIPRNFACSMAELAWRVSSPLHALQILHPILFPENSFLQSATDKEKTFYCAALNNLGATVEAQQISSSVDSRLEPEVLLIQSIGHFKSWNYQAAVPLLKQYLTHPELSAYKKLIGKVNLAAALICLFDFDSARTWLDEIQAECEAGSYTLLLGNCYELRGQIEFFQRNFEAATPHLEKSASLLQKQSGDFSLYAEKWLALCNCMKNPSSENFKKLNIIRERARAILNWETLRDCDLFESVAVDDLDLQKKVVMGSPFEAYRKRARSLLGKNIIPQGQFLWKLGARDPSAAPRAEITKSFSPYVQQKSQALHEQPLLLALFEALTLDFYKPSHIGLLFQNIYPGEKFNPFTSPDRVLKLIKRLNLWFRDQQVPLEVPIKKSEFALCAVQGVEIQVVVQRAQKLSKEAGTLVQLKETFKDRSFTAQKVADRFQISRASAQTVISKAVESGDLIKIGNGRSTEYRLISKRSRKPAA